MIYGADELPYLETHEVDFILDFVGAHCDLAALEKQTTGRGTRKSIARLKQGAYTMLQKIPPPDRSRLQTISAHAAPILPTQMWSSNLPAAGQPHYGPAARSRSSWEPSPPSNH